MLILFVIACLLVAVSQGLDVYTTLKGIRDGLFELNGLAAPLTRHPVLFYALKVGAIFIILVPAIIYGRGVPGWLWGIAAGLATAGSGIGFYAARSNSKLIRAIPAKT